MQSINLCSQHEIGFGQTVDFVGPDLDADLAPSEIDVRVMSFLLSEFANLVGELQGIHEVGERELTLNVMFFDDVPVVYLGLVACQFGTLQGRDATLTGNTILLSKTTQSTSPQDNPSM